MKKSVKLLLAATAMMSLVACTKKDEEPAIGGDPSTWGPEETEDVEIPSPMHAFDTINEVIADAGFEIVIPETIDGYSTTTYYTYDLDSKMIEVHYDNGENSVDIRKMAGTDVNDISGVYTTYSNSTTISANEAEVEVSGEGETYHVATWNMNGYNYSVYSDAGMSLDMIEAIITQVQ